MTLTYNEPLLSALIYHNLKTRNSDLDTVQPRTLEKIIADGFGLRHTGDESYYADGVLNNIQVSTKTRRFDPTILKRNSSRDFITNPEKFLGPKYIPKYDIWENGVQIVQRRQALPFDDISASAEEVGKASLEGFYSNVQESYNRYNTDTSYEVVAVHGFSINPNYYILRLFWQPYVYLDNASIEWVREKNKVVGYQNIDNKRYKIAERINGNANREATCFIEYKNLLSYEKSAIIKTPIPKMHDFELNTTLEEIEWLNKYYDELNLFE